MRARADGLNLYCRYCIREKLQAMRARRKSYVAATGIKRKPCRAAGSLLRVRDPLERVRLAFRRGITDRKEIKRATRLPWDTLTDCIAVLNDQREIKWDSKRREFQIAA